MSKIQLHQIEKGTGDKVLDFFVAIGAISQVVIGIILICQLEAYKASNDLTRKAIILSHTPWVSITKLNVSFEPPQTSTITFHIENHSDYPIFKMKSCQLEFTDGSTEPEVDVRSLLDSRTSNDTIMPHDERFFINSVSDPMEESFVKKFYSDQATLEIYVQYEDVFHRKMIFKNTIRSDARGPSSYRVIDSHIDGFDNFNVPEL